MNRPSLSILALLLLVGCTKEDQKPPPLIGDPSYDRMIFFDFDSADLTQQSRNTLGQFAIAAKSARGGGRVLVCGHADKVGSAQANLALSQKRAETTRQALVELGFPVDGIIVLALGDTQPLVLNKANGSDPQNRRVDIEFEHSIGLGVGACRAAFQRANLAGK
jgi:outer membrane protein OmpA-like peptidoglycan-associated protein